MEELYYNDANLKVMEREFTGFAPDPDAQTTVLTNRPDPSTKKRESDPEYYETRWEYNQDALLSRTVFPNGNVERQIYEGDLNPLASALTRGNLRAHILLPGQHSPAGDQEQH